MELNNAAEDTSAVRSLLPLDAASQQPYISLSPSIASTRSELEDRCLIYSCSILINFPNGLIKDI